MRCNTTKCQILWSFFPITPEPLPVSCWWLHSTGAPWSCQSANCICWLILHTAHPWEKQPKKFMPHSPPRWVSSVPQFHAVQGRQQPSRVPSAFNPKGNHLLCDTGECAYSCVSYSVPNTTTAQPSRTAIRSCLILIFALKSRNKIQCDKERGGGSIYFSILPFVWNTVRDQLGL